MSPSTLLRNTEQNANMLRELLRRVRPEAAPEQNVPTPEVPKAKATAQGFVPPVRVETQAGRTPALAGTVRSRSVFGINCSSW